MSASLGAHERPQARDPEDAQAGQILPVQSGTPRRRIFNTACRVSPKVPTADRIACPHRTAGTMGASRGAVVPRLECPLASPAFRRCEFFRLPLLSGRIPKRNPVPVSFPAAQSPEISRTMLKLAGLALRLDHWATSASQSMSFRGLARLAPKAAIRTGSCLCALRRRIPSIASSVPAVAQCSAMRALRQRLTFRRTRCTTLKTRSIMLVQAGEGCGSEGS